MRVDTGHDRTVRLLTAQLEAIAAVSERLPAGAAPYAFPKLEAYVQRAAAATRNAVRLELITDDEAGDIWAAVMRRHPEALLRAGWLSLAA